MGGWGVRGEGKVRAREEGSTENLDRCRGDRVRVVGAVDGHVDVVEAGGDARRRWARDLGGQSESRASEGGEMCERERHA